MIYPATEENIAKAAELIRNGALVAFPTETVYGLGANALDEKAVEKIYEVKRRPKFNPIIAHVASAEDISQVAAVDGKDIRRTLEKLTCFWPGPLSVVLPKRNELPDIVTGGLSSVAVRIPEHPVARSLLLKSERPIAAPSANRFSQISPTSAKHVEESLSGDIELILDGGSCKVGLESTVLSLIDDCPLILRHGGVTLEQLREVLGEVNTAQTLPTKEEAPLSPGMLARHYAPKTKLEIIGESTPSSYPPRVGLVSFGSADEEKFDYAVVNSLSTTGDSAEIAVNLFSSLREMDTMGLDLIVVDSCPEEGLGRAIMDRLRRATH